LDHLLSKDFLGNTRPEGPVGDPCDLLRNLPGTAASAPSSLACVLWISPAPPGGPLPTSDSRSTVVCLHFYLRLCPSRIAGCGAGPFQDGLAPWPAASRDGSCRGAPGFGPGYRRGPSRCSLTIRWQSRKQDNQAVVVAQSVSPQQVDPYGSEIVTREGCAASRDAA
jgi:hypothetical protein